MNKIKLVAILRGIQPAEAADHIETLINAGFRYIEIPLNSPDWQQSIPAMVRQFGERAMIGAGTVLKVEQVDFLAEAGAKLIVTPNTAPAVIRGCWCAPAARRPPRRLAHWMPGRNG